LIESRAKEDGTGYVTQVTEVEKVIIEADPDSNGNMPNIQIRDNGSSQRTSSTLRNVWHYDRAALTDNQFQSSSVSPFTNRSVGGRTLRFPTASQKANESKVVNGMNKNMNL
jgi:hypothetical protein